MAYTRGTDEVPDVWGPRTSWVLPSLHRNSRRLLSDVGRAARYASGKSLMSSAADVGDPTTLEGSRQSLRRHSIAHSSVEVSQSPETFSFLAMTKDEKITLLCLALVDMFAYLCMSIMAPFFPVKVAAVGASQTVSGVVFSVYAFTIFIASPIFAKLIPLIGPKFTFVAGIFVASGCNFLFGFLEYVHEPTSFTILALVIRVVEGFGAAAFSTASFSILAYEFSGNVAVVFGTLEAFVGVGMTVGPAMGGFLYSVGGFKFPFFAVGTLMLLMVPLNLWLLPTQIHIVTKPKKGSQMRFFKNPLVYMVGLTIFAMASIWGFLDPTLQPHLAQFELSPGMVGLVFLMISGTYAIFSPFWGWVAEKIDNTDLMMVIGGGVSGVALLFLGPSPFIHLPSKLWISLVCLGIMGAAIGMALIPTLESLLYISEEAGMEENMGTYALVSGVWGSAYSLGEVVGPVLGGYLDEVYGFQMCSSVMAAICLVTATIFFGYVVVEWIMVAVERKRSNAEPRKPGGLASWRTPLKYSFNRDIPYRTYVDADISVSEPDLAQPRSDNLTVPEAYRDRAQSRNSEDSDFDCSIAVSV